eukprot:c17823_g1_i3.p2 GENE.c17823_g1_i3~~c17823_g1_i3.p2  ORF type:complete len:126 (+),score=17.41 c17823_g1_i3:95-472(+)
MSLLPALPKLALALAALILVRIAIALYRRSSRTRQEVALLEDRCIAYLRRRPGIDIPITHLRDEYLAKDRHKKKALWAKVCAGVQLDTRVTRSQATIEGQPRDCWRWTAHAGDDETEAPMISKLA